ncbi:hypothetical protein [Mycobacterium sp. 1274761.0]|uniref:hypothetical protein n=1 Tax=Mycobacterium sp. 1274761.0 TaxID=1834077 RepID=UPI0007FE2A9F|nr:hypothetical protein [Mycobacterium sp. 1274761.0]OBK70249.1 hypothetical protein A5651_23095 [Mycobacterium sp. 1274761.0]
MRLRKQTPPAVNGDHVDESAKETDATAVDALALAEEAEAQAAEAEAVAAAARARARALRLRRKAEEATAAETVAASKPDTSEAGLEEVEDKDVLNEDVLAKETGVADADAESGEAVGAAPDDAEEFAAERTRTSRSRRFPRPSWKAVVGTLTVLLIAALLVGCGYMYWFHRQAQGEQQRRAEFEAAARQGVVTLMSLDYNKAKEDVQRIIDNSTGQFKQDFQNTADDFVNVAIDSKAITETNVTATAVESMNKDDTATVLVAASSRVTNAAGAKQEPRAWRLSVNLARDGGQLKLAKVEFVP